MQSDTSVEAPAKTYQEIRMEKAQSAPGKILISLQLGLPITLVGFIIFYTFGSRIREESCRFVQSPACVVVYRPDLFQCDFVYADYNQRSVPAVPL